MNKLTIAAAAAGFALALPFAATAQNNPPSMTFDEALTAAADPAGVSALEGMRVSSVNVVKLSELTDNDPDRLTTWMTDNASNISSVRSAIEANADLKAQLETQNIGIGSVVGVGVGADGTVTVITQ